MVYKLIEEPFFDSNPCIVHSSSVLLLSAKRPSSLWQELVASSRAWLQHGVAACAMVTCCAEIFIVLAAVVVIYIATRSVGVLLRDLVFLRRHGVKSGGFRSSWILGVTYSTIQIYRWEQCLAKGHGIAWPSWLTACVRRIASSQRLLFICSAFSSHR